MNRGRCQICGRLKPRKKDGTMVHHHVQGIPCTGKNSPPIEEDDAFLEAEATRYAAAGNAIRLTIRDLKQRRVNYIDPALIAAAERAEEKAAKLRRRLDRHRGWPDRYHRQMDRYGWASPPPPYLLERLARNG